jgi:hypothetical protein
MEKMEEGGGTVQGEEVNPCFWLRNLQLARCGYPFQKQHEQHSMPHGPRKDKIGVSKTKKSVQLNRTAEIKLGFFLPNAFCNSASVGSHFFFKNFFARRTTRSST